MDLDLPNPRYNAAVRQLKEAVYRRAVRVPGVVIGVARDAVERELHELHQMPERARRDAAFELFSACFDHYLPKKFIRNHVYGGGREIKLSEQEMIDCNASISVMSCKAFVDELATLNAAGTAASKVIDLRCPAVALTNGTLGNFTVPMHATLTYRGPSDWDVVGKMSFYDKWDFDPKEFGASNRSTLGEIRTRVGHLALPGQGFEITSVEVDFGQGSADPIITWKGGKPVGVPDRLSKPDVELANME